MVFEFENNEDKADLKYRGWKYTEYLNDPDNIKIVKELISEHPTSIRLIDNPSLELQKIAVLKSPVAIYGIENPDPKVIELHNISNENKYETPSDTERTCYFDYKNYDLVDNPDDVEDNDDNVDNDVENNDNNYEFDEDVENKHN